MGARLRPQRVSPRGTTLLVVALVVVAALFAANHLARMDARFFGLSVPAARALAHYFAGDYGGAARFYREALRRQTLPSAPALSWILFARGELEQAEVQARMES